MGLVKTFVSFTELVNKVQQRLGGTPTPMESKLVIDLASTVCSIFNQIESKVEEIESNRELQDTDDSLDGIDVLALCRLQVGYIKILCLTMQGTACIMAVPLVKGRAIRLTHITH